MSDTEDPTEPDADSGADDTTEIEVDPGVGDPTEVESNSRKLAALQAELEAVQAQLDTKKSRRRFLDRSRGFVAVVGVLLSCLLVAAAVLGIWVRRSFLDTDGFVERAGSLVDDPEVQVALAGWLSGEVNQLIDAEEVIADALPEEASLLAVPLSGAVEGFVQDQVRAVVASDVFADLWKGSVEVAHTTASEVLSGDNSELIEAQEEGVVINLLPVINEVLAEITSASPEIFGQTVDIPDVQVEDVPDEARETISEAIGVEIDEDFGTFVIYDEGALSSAQQAVELVDALVWLFVVAAPLVIAGTLWVSTRRRRTTLQLTVGIALVMVLLRRLVLLFQDDLLDLVQKPENLGAVDVTASAFLDPLLDGALWVGVAALVIAAVAAVTGPYGWAVSLRRAVVDFSGAAVTAVSNRSQDEDTLVWIAANRDALQIGGAVVGVLLLWWLDVSWIGFFVLAGLVGLFELGVTRFGDRGEALQDDTDTDTAGDGDGDGEAELAAEGRSG
jgi:hypothetical protein